MWWFTEYIKNVYLVKLNTSCATQDLSLTNGQGRNLPNVHFKSSYMQHKNYLSN